MVGDIIPWVKTHGYNEPSLRDEDPIPGLLDIRSQGYGEDSDWHGLSHDDVLDEPDTAFISTRWQPLELWPH